jgi:hypothetical protein
MAKKKAVKKKAKVTRKKAVRKPKDPCNPRLKNEKERQHDWWKWVDEVGELEAPAVKLRQVMGDFEESFRAEVMIIIGERDEPHELDMYHRITTAFDNLMAATQKVEEASKQMRQRYVANQRSYQDPKTKEWVQVSTGIDNTSLLSQYKDVSACGCT